MLTPVSIVIGLLVALLSLLLLPLAGIALIYRGTHVPRRQVARVGTEGKAEVVTHQGSVGTRSLTWQQRWREPAVWLPIGAGLILLLLPLWGRSAVHASYPAVDEEPVPLHGEIHELKRGDGTTIHAEVFGSVGAPTLILTHGWSTDNTEWFYTKEQLAGQFRLIVWDLPGLGETMPTADNDFSLERMASDLRIVLGLANDKPVVIVGHSIGGIINLTFCKLYPQELGSRVAGIVELDSSYTNPVRTTKNSEFNLALQKPLAEPILKLMIPLSGLFRALNWLSYQEGLQSASNAQSAFDGTESQGQLDLVSKYAFLSSPAVVARGTLAMFHWDMTPELAHITIPVLMIVGKDDSTTLPAASGTMAKTIPHGRLLVLPIRRHYALLESNKLVDAAVAHFADEVLG